jgi:hypothetical protein
MTPVADRDRDIVSGDPSEQFRWSSVDFGGGVQGAVNDEIDDVPATVAGRTGGADGGVVRPHGSVVVAERGVGGHIVGQRPQAPARPQPRLGETVDEAVGEINVGDA